MSKDRDIGRAISSSSISTNEAAGYPTSRGNSGIFSPSQTNGPEPNGSQQDSSASTSTIKESNETHTKLAGRKSHVKPTNGHAAQSGGATSERAQTPSVFLRSDETELQDQIHTQDPGPDDKKLSTGTSGQANKVKDTWRRIVGGRGGEIDGLLIFAAIISATATAFIIDSYRYMNPKSPNECILIIRQIGARFGSLVAIAGHLDSTKPVYADAHPSSIMAATTALWLVSLTLSLMSASADIAIREWLSRHGGEPAGTGPPTRVRIWHVQHKGSMDWRIADLLDVPPALLQMAIASSLAGLVILLCSLHPVIVGIIIVQAAALRMTPIVTTVASPIRRWYPQALEAMQSVHERSIPETAHLVAFHGLTVLCRLASEIPWLISLTVQRLKTMPLFVIIHGKAVILVKGWPQTWKVYQMRNLQMDDPQLAPIVATDKLLMDDEFLAGFVRPYLNDLENPELVFKTLSSVVEQRTDRSKSGTRPYSWDKWAERTEEDSQSLTTLGHIVLDFLLRCELTADPQSQKISIFDADKDCRQYIEPCMHYLLGLLLAIPGTQPEVYLRISEAITEKGVPKYLRAGMARALSEHNDRFTLNRNDVQKLMDCVSTVEADGSILQYICMSILSLSSRLPESDARRIHTSYEAAISTALQRIATEQDWDRFGGLLYEFASFADGRVAARIVTGDILSLWKELAASHDDSEQGMIALWLENLRGLAGIPAPRVDFYGPETKMDMLMRAKKEWAAQWLPAWVAKRNKGKIA
ncbi:hypothetical protein WOLCODRAFT_159218 [Wolfiporia cocos MD-104 SS10]|uniref:DUF6535 domain-containing protein n=1 Tax=Wolfiporia cocos (strain MD-104) TaxID=742152 RepID=A0A2H3JCL3_WOLCO|nr:hypothetical protein WOLCODRAFT_159218 [Wolfiporia cocos MD-104 SS10]